MRKAVLFLAVMVLAAVSLPAFSQDFPDVSADHWAYQAVHELVNAGLIQGYPDGTFHGKRTMTRYEFAEAIARAVAVLEQRIPATAVPPTPIEARPPRRLETANAATPQQFDMLQNLINEFRDELASLGVDVEALRRSVASIRDRVIALETEMARVRLSGNGDLVGRGEVRNTDALVFDLDNRAVAFDAGLADRDNLLANSRFLSNLSFGLRSNAARGANLNALINAGNYMSFALDRGDGILTSTAPLDDFLLWNLYADTALRLGPLGPTQIIVGRHPFQLTPFTLRFVDPDSYAQVPVLDSGDYLLDGARATFNFGPSSVTAFTSKVTRVGGNEGTLLRANLQLGAAVNGTDVDQIGGVRAVIGTPLSGNLGLTWYEAGLNPLLGTASVFGADISASVRPNVGISGEYARVTPNPQLEDAFEGTGENNFAWNARLSYGMGRLGLGAGYILVKENYVAPGYWLRSGRAVNLRNVRGALANVSYAVNDRLSITAEGQFLQPDEGDFMIGRTAVEQGPAVNPDSVDKLTYWKAGVRYGITATDSIDLGWEEGKWDSTLAGAQSTRERYITVGFGHSMNPNTSLKLLYQIVDYRQGDVNPYAQEASARGGVAAAQFELKY